MSFTSIGLLLLLGRGLYRRTLRPWEAGVLAAVWAAAYALFLTMGWSLATFIAPVLVLMGIAMTRMYSRDSRL